MSPDAIRIRDAIAVEATLLEAPQRRSSDIWEAYRPQLAAKRDAIFLPPTVVDNGWVRVTVAGDQIPVGLVVDSR